MHSVIRLSQCPLNCKMYFLENALQCALNATFGKACDIPNLDQSKGWKRGVSQKLMTARRLCPCVSKFSHIFIWICKGCVSWNPILDPRILNRPPSTVMLKGPPLKSEIGWTGQLWSKTIAFFSLILQLFFFNFQTFGKKVIISIIFLILNFHSYFFNGFFWTCGIFYIFFLGNF